MAPGCSAVVAVAAAAAIGGAFGTRAVGPIVQTTDGPVQGVMEGSVAAFRGIPFAAPAVGDLRWRPPQPVAPWTAPRDASTWGNSCVQSDGAGSEDCLFINVHSPRGASSTSKLPVFLWIHGGGYQDGNGNVNGTALIESLGGRALVVSANYRLNIFGFLGGAALRSRDAAGSTGNYGIQDQRAAMVWAQRNIAAFGGDPTRVLIYGCSAGGGSMTNHLSTPKSAGLFSRVIIQSGSFPSWSAKPQPAAEEVFGEILNATQCAATDIDCLVALSPAKLTAAIHAIPTGLCCSNLQGFPWIPWSPVIDGVELAAHPWVLAAQGNVNKVPVMHGTCTDEGAIFTSAPREFSQSALDAAWAEWYGPAMGPSSASQLDAAYGSLTFPPNSPTFTATRAWWEAQRAEGDQAFVCPAQYTSERLSSIADLPVYEYWFDYPSNPTMPTVLHCSQMQFQFQSLPSWAPAEAVELADAIATYFYNFAATGDPNGGSDLAATVPLPRWVRYSGGTPMVQKLDVASRHGIQAVNVTDRLAKRCAFIDAWIEAELKTGTPSRTQFRAQI